MIRNRKTFTAAALLAMAGTTAACTTDPVTGERRVARAGIGAGAGVAGGYLLGSILGGRNSRTARIVGAGIGGIAGAGVGAYMDRQERELRQRTAGTDVDIRRDGDDLLLNLPSGITFATNQAAVQPQFRQTLDQVASTLSEYDQTYLDVYGHTDSTGNDSINQPLSERRARAVADYLSTRGVQSARIETRGFGSTQPVADDGTEAGRAQNRRVEIRIVPVTENDVRR